MTGTIATRPASPPSPLRWKLVLAVAIVFATVAAIVGAAALVVWSRIPADLQSALALTLEDSAGLVLMFAAFLLVALSMLVGAAYRAYVERVVRLADGARVILDANPAHRLEDEGAPEAAALARRLNPLADPPQSAQGAIERRVRDAQAELAEEKHRLAALMSELTDSVLVCNAEGLILLYNDAARVLFDRPAENGRRASGIVGLGRSVFGIIDRDMIAHALDLVLEHLQRGEARPADEGDERADHRQRDHERYHEADRDLIPADPAGDRDAAVEQLERRGPEHRRHR